jgi:hypothetical protein
MFKRYELHNHTTESDALISCEALVNRMVEDGVDCFAITDHNTISGQPIIRRLLAERGLSLQCAYGMEYTTYFGHIVCPVLETYVPWDSINRHKPELLFEACKRAGGITGIAHPFAYGEPFAQGCRFEMDIHDFTNVDYIEVMNAPEPLLTVNMPALRWWEELVLSGVRVSACAGMDMHRRKDRFAMKFATYAEGEEGGDCVAELRAALSEQRVWISKGMLVDWHREGKSIRFALYDAKKPGFMPAETYILTLKSREGVREYDITGGVLTLPLSELSEVEIPKLYGGEVKLENLICVAPVIRKEA